jgi:hypothetical protein
MAKKAQTANSTSAATTTLADAIRTAFQDLGEDAEKDAVARWIKQQHPSLKYKDTTFNSSFSSIRKKLRGDVPTSALTVNELMKVKDMAKEEGGVDKLIALLDKVDAIGKKVGGVPRLRSALRGLKRLAT